MKEGHIESVKYLTKKTHKYQRLWDVIASLCPCVICNIDIRPTLTPTTKSPEMAFFPVTPQKVAFFLSYPIVLEFCTDYGKLMSYSVPNFKTVEQPKRVLWTRFRDIWV